MNYRKPLMHLILVNLVISTNVLANEIKHFQYKIPRESKIFTEYQSEKDPRKKKDLEQKMVTECPFKKTDSSLDNLTKSALSLQATSSNFNNQNNCRARLQGFSESIVKTQELQKKVRINAAELTKAEMTEEEIKSIEEGLKNTQVAATTFNEILRSGCEFKNSTRDISSVGNQIINLLDAGTTTLAFTNPSAAIITAAASISGRLVISLSRWISETDENQALAKEASESGRFVNELCLFRNLAYKYDDLYLDPLSPPDLELLARQVTKNRAVTAAEEMRQCVNKPSNDAFVNLTNFSKDLAAAVDGVTSQKQCMGLLKKYNTHRNAEGINHFKNLAASYGCPIPNPGLSENAIMFCSAWDTVEKLSTGNIYEKCEDDNFQKTVTKKFTTLAELIFQSAHEKAKINPVNKDDLQKLRDLEKEELIANQRYAALEASLKESMMSNVNATKSMVALGRTVLGERFDDFSKEIMKDCSDDLYSAGILITKLISLKKKTEKTKEPTQKAQRQREVCTKANEARSKLATAYQSSMGIREICTFMRGNGIPPLKSSGLNFDNYSSENTRKLFFKKPYISERCDDINKKTNRFIDEVEAQTAVIDSMGCNF
jgi:hypothetical protein